MKTHTITQKERRPISKQFYQISRELHHGVPLESMDTILRDNGFMLVQEDGTPWSGFLCGREGSCTIEIHTLEGVPCNNLLALQWYKRVSTYEVNCYLS